MNIDEFDPMARAGAVDLNLFFALIRQKVSKDGLINSCKIGLNTLTGVPLLFGPLGDPCILSLEPMAVVPNLFLYAAPAPLLCI